MGIIDIDFVDLLLASKGVLHPRPNPAAVDAGRFDWLLVASASDFRIWLAEDVAAHEVPFEKAEPEVLAAQRMIDARTRALNYVLTLTDQGLKDRKWPPDFQTREKEVKSFLEAQKQGRVFELDNVARLQTPDSLPNMTVAERPYYAYKAPDSDFPYPPANLVDRLMSLYTPGEAVFLKDRPEKNFYIAVLLERSVPTLEDFKKVYENADNLLLRDPLWDNCVRDQRQEFTKQFIRHMREEWTGELDDKGRINVPKDVRDKYDKTGS